MAYCSKCGGALADTDSFCGKCGTAAASPTAPRTGRPTIPVKLAGCGLVVLAVAAAILVPTFLQAREAAQRAQCGGFGGRLPQLAYGLTLYAKDHDGRLPLASEWLTAASDSLLKHHGVRIPPEDEACPSRKELYGYAFNEELSGRVLYGPGSTVARPYDTPMLFESSLNAPNASDRLESFVRPHRGKGFVAYADGHVRAATDPPPADAGLSEAAPN